MGVKLVKKSLLLLSFLIIFVRQDSIIPCLQGLYHNPDNARASYNVERQWSGGILAETTCPGYFFCDMIFSTVADFRSGMVVFLFLWVYL